MVSERGLLARLHGKEVVRETKKQKATDTKQNYRNEVTRHITSHDCSPKSSAPHQVGASWSKHHRIILASLFFCLLYIRGPIDFELQHVASKALTDAGEKKKREGKGKEKWELGLRLQTTGPTTTKESL